MVVFVFRDELELPKENLKNDQMATAAADTAQTIQYLKARDAYGQRNHLRYFAMFSNWDEKQ